MHRHRETNPHFTPQRFPPLKHEPPEPRRPLSLPLSPHPDAKEQTHDPLPPELHGTDSHIPTPTPPILPSRQQPQPRPHSGASTSNSAHHNQPHRHSAALRVPTRRNTKPLAWIVAGLCALFWIMVIVVGLAILIIYLVFRPRNPKFDISSATLNAAYVDMGYLLNADLTVLANFTNPNKKGRVDFRYAIIDLYHGDNLIASSYIDPFTTMRHESKFEDVHLVSSQVRLSLEHGELLKKQMGSGRVKFEVKGMFRARSNLGGFLRYSYWLYGHCTIMVTSPPSGVLIGRRCTTKR